MNARNLFASASFLLVGALAALPASASFEPVASTGLAATAASAGSLHRADNSADASGDSSADSAGDRGSADKGSDRGSADKARQRLGRQGLEQRLDGQGLGRQGVRRQRLG